MRIEVLAKPYSRTAEVQQTGPTSYTVRVDAPAEGGQANARLIELLADHLKIPRTKFRIVSGATARRKVLDITTR